VRRVNRACAIESLRHRYSRAYLRVMLKPVLEGNPGERDVRWNDTSSVYIVERYIDVSETQKWPAMARSPAASVRVLLGLRGDIKGPDKECPLYSQKQPVHRWHQMSAKNGTRNRVNMWAQGPILTRHEYILNVGFRSHFCAKQSLIRVP
jgi:hypothetical protein